MTKKIWQLLLTAQIKSTGWYIGIYTLIMIILLTIFSFVPVDDTSWIPTSSVYSPKIYLLVIGITHPASMTKLFVCNGLTRKQFFWLYTSIISIVALFLLIPILISDFYYGNLSLASAVTHYLQMTLFFLIGWTVTLGYQFRRWYTKILGVLAAIVLLDTITTLSESLALADFASLGLTLLIFLIMLIILPRIIVNISLKN